MLTLPSATVTDTTLFHCPGCGQDRLRLPRSRGGLLTEEHIIPQALGNERWSIALCGSCNAIFNQQFESAYLNEKGIVRARSQLPRTTRRPTPKRWTSLTRIRTGEQETLIQKKFAPLHPEEQVQALPTGTFKKQGMFQQLPPELDHREVVMSEYDWSWSVRLRACLKIGLEQLFFHMGLSAEELELTPFLRGLLFSSEDDLIAHKEAKFGERLCSFGSERDSLLMQSGGPLIPHTVRFNHGFDLRALELETRAIESFWSLGSHLLRARVRRLDVNVDGRCQAVIHVSQEILGLAATVVRIHLNDSDLSHLPRKFLLQDVIDTRTGERRTTRQP